MRSLTKLTILWLLLLKSAPAFADLEKRDNVTLAAPVVVPVSQHWEGVDGTWSTFEIRVGTPENVYRVLPATSWQETWVVYGAAAGVCNTSVGVPADCADSRGGLFNSAASSTWDQGKGLSQYSLGLNSDLGYNGVGQYGFDTVGLGYTNSTSSDGGPTLTHQIVAEIVSDTWWFGMLGIGFQPTNFSGYGDPQPSFSDTLYSQGLISSMSWSYTAGAYYRLKSIFGQLIFGGYDASRFTPNDVVFSMTGDNLRDIVVTIQSITSSTSAGNTTLLSSPIFSFIDSTVPEIWLPVSVCQELEKALGLTLDKTTGLYLINDTVHKSLLSLNPTLTFTLTNQKSSNSPTTTITLPYASFDLNATSPFLTNTSSLYFPIRQATDESQYTLGRTFLQEAYVTADYNSRIFNVSQCVFENNVDPKIIAIPSNLPSSTPNPSGGSSHPSSGSGSHHKSISVGAIAGIVLGCIALLLCLGFLSLFCRRRRRRQQHLSPTSTPAGEKDRPSHEIGPGKPDDTTAYLDNEERLAATTAPGMEADGLPPIAEMPGHDATIEIAGYPIMHPQELEGDGPALSATTPTTPRAVGSGRVEGGERGAADVDHIVSPASAGSQHSPGSVLGRGRPQIMVSSPSSEGTSGGGWSPSTPVQRTGTGGSRFRERLT